MGEDAAPPADYAACIDDRTGARPAVWRFFTDAVMGGLSTGAMAEALVAGRPALCLRGHVRLGNGGGFIQMALELPAGPPAPAASAAIWRGIELDVRGNGHRYGLHLRTEGMALPWQAWRASFTAPPEWQTVQLPFAAFTPYRTVEPLDASAVRRIGIVAIGEAMHAEVCVTRLAWLR